MMYSLEYGMFIQMLQQFGYSGEAHALLPPRTHLKGGGWAILVLLNGVVISHIILDKNRQKILHDESAHSIIARFGVLEWQLVNAAATATNSEDARHTGPIQIPAAKMANPHRQPISAVQMRQWSRMQRHVYSLADGTRSIEQIATLLFCSSATIEQVIRELQIAGAIK